MNFDEVYFGGNTNFQHRPYVQHLTKLGFSATNYAPYTAGPPSKGVSPADQSAICVLMIYEFGPKSGAAAGEDLGTLAVGTFSYNTTDSPSNCPACESPDLARLGAGTQKLERELARELPELELIRLDDALPRKHAKRDIQ